MEESVFRVQLYDRVFSISLTDQCNFSCPYCISEQSKDACLQKVSVKPGRKHLFEYFKELTKFLLAQEMTVRVDFNGGEPFCCTSFIDISRKVTKKHFITINTNNVSPDISRFTYAIDPGKVLCVNASVHLHELARKKLFEVYIRNFFKWQRCGFCVVATIVAYPPLADQALEYTRFLTQAGIDFSWVPFYGRYNDLDYPGAYSLEQLQCFGFQESVRYERETKGKRCNAGYNMFAVFPGGKITACYNSHAAIGDVHSGFKPQECLSVCGFDKCNCPFYLYYGPEYLPINIRRL